MGEGGSRIMVNERKRNENSCNLPLNLYFSICLCAEDGSTSTYVFAQKLG